MKKLLSLMGLAMAMFSQEPAKQGDVKKITDAEELQKFIKEQSNVFFLDVREPKEIAELGSLKGYVNIPLGELEKRMKEVPKEKNDHHRLKRRRQSRACRGHVDQSRLYGSRILWIEGLERQEEAPGGRAEVEGEH